MLNSTYIVDFRTLYIDDMISEDYNKLRQKIKNYYRGVLRFIVLICILIAVISAEQQEEEREEPKPLLQKYKIIHYN